MTEGRFEVAGKGPVSWILERPSDARVLLVLAHGAGAGMRHAFMQALVSALAAHSVATFRYQFPYAEAGKRRPDARGTLIGSVRSAVAQAASLCPELPLFAGGKSMGGRMTSLAASEKPLEGVRGLVFVGFPLHAAGKPSSERAAHLAQVSLPMLFLQGTRDGLAQLDLLEPVCNSLGKRATLHVVEGGDHSFRVLKRSGRTDEEVLEELASQVASWTAAHD